MRYLNENFLEAINANPRYQAMVENMQKEVNDFYANFHDDPSVNSEWGHRYFCDEDGGRLIFDINKPHEHVCEVCGKVYSDKLHDGVWVYMYRNQAVLTAWKAAALYKVTNDKKYLDITKNIISFYANNYTKFEIHNKEVHVFKNYEEMQWGCGRILPQGLNESIIAIRMINALEILKDDLDKEFLDNCYNKMFREIFYLLKPQVDQIHNIRCWNNTAIGVIGLFYNDKEMIDFAFNGEFNVNRQLREGVTKDNFWYEGSIHYNFFTLEGVTNLLLFAKLYNYPVEEEELVKKMFIEAYHYAFDNHRFPNPNDGWPSINLKTYSYIYHVAAKVFGYDSEVCNILKNIENNPLPRTPLPLSKPYYFNNEISFERFLLNTGLDLTDYTVVKPLTKNFPLSQFGMLRNKNFNIFMKYGLNGPSHAHPDLMNIEVMYKDYMISRDLSNPGYQSKRYKDWFKMSVSHNTVVVNGKNMTKTSPCDEVIYKDGYIKSISSDVYPGVKYEREISLNATGYDDHFNVYSDVENTYDYVFHFEECLELVKNYKAETSSLGFNEFGYEHIKDVQLLNHENSLTLTFIKGNDKINVTLDDLAGKKVFICKTFDNPVNHIRTTLVIREIAKNAKFNLKLEVK